MLLAAGMVISFLFCDRLHAGEIVEFRSLKELESYFQKIGYTSKTWNSGQLEIPRVYLHSIPGRWKRIAEKDVTVQQKKSYFFISILPLILRTNEMINEKRSKARMLIDASLSGNKLSLKDRAWLENLAAEYRVVRKKNRQLNNTRIKEILNRVDMIPSSMALGQAAYESGYGTSRFAGLGNALFGQWTWDGKGITPESQRKELGNHKIAAFDTVLDSMIAYAKNLNSHEAYSEFRKKRARLRKDSKHLKGLALTDTLGSYSEKGRHYVVTLRSIIKTNHLDSKDAAFLKAMPSVTLIAVDPVTGHPVL